MINIDVTCFHNPDEENWYLSKFEYGGITYSSMEQYMMYQKARYFDDEYIMGRILNTDNPREIKLLGRKVSNFDSVQWNGVRQVIVYNGLIAKFSQNNLSETKIAADQRQYSGRMFSQRYYMGNWNFHA